MALPFGALFAAGLLALAVGVLLNTHPVDGHPTAASASVRSHPMSRESLLNLPVAAQGPVSADLGAEQLSYRVSAERDGFRMANPAQQLHARFAHSTVSVRSGATRVGFSLRAIGYGRELRAVTPAAPHGNANRVLYSHTGISEWYANGPLGLEQGFSIPRAPAGDRAAPLALSMALSGDARASLVNGGRAVSFTRAGKTVLRYAGLTAIGAGGRKLHSWLQLQGGRLLIRVDTRGARYPLRVDPFIQQGSKLTGTGETVGGFMGWSVAISADGSTALVGGPNTSNGAGAAWVFTRTGETWIQQGEELTRPEPHAYGGFGTSVALSADGNTALVGDPGYAIHGAAWVFTRSGNTWTQQGAPLALNDPSSTEEPDQSGQFGGSVALAADGQTALVGNLGANHWAGAAWVFTRSGETWNQGQMLAGSGGEEDFGWSVALSGDGNTALIGKPPSSFYTEDGAAWVFARTGETWAQQGEKLAGQREDGAEFGYSVALSYDGSTALVGSTSGHTSTSAVWFFARSGETWRQQGEKITRPSGRGYDQFGESVALSASGNLALIGAPGGNPGGGSAWLFSRSGETWVQLGERLRARGGRADEEFAQSVALSADGSTALVGASESSGAGNVGHGGAAWAFLDERSAPTVVTEAPSLTTETTATLNATVNPNGELVTSCRFEYGTTESYGASVDCSSLPGSEEAAVPVSADVTNLEPNTTYHFRVVATNATGTAYGSDQTAPNPGVESAGSEQGLVEIVGSPAPVSGLTAEELNPQYPPPTGVALVGAVSYRIAELMPGSSVYVTLRLPAGSEPTEVYKLIEGKYVNITAIARFAGESVTLHLTDGGLGDEDNEANGIIVDPVVPVGTAGKRPQSVAFVSQPPASTPIGTQYTLLAAATSGLPVTFSIDPASTGGACTLTGSIVSFTAPGSCVVDASQAGNATYKAAPKVQQMMDVVMRGTQEIAFSAAAPTAPNAGSVYVPTATTSSGLPATFSIDPASSKKACTLTGNTVAFKKAGTCIIDADQAGSSSYLPAPQVQQTMIVTTATAATNTSLTLAYPTTTYGSEQADKVTVTTTAAGGGTMPKGKVTVMAGPSRLCKIALLNGTGSCTPKATALKAGSYSITATLTASSKFGGSTSPPTNLTINPAAGSKASLLRHKKSRSRRGASRG